MVAFILVEAHAGETAHANIDNGADGICMMNNTTVMHFESLKFPTVMHSSILPD